MGSVLGAASGREDDPEITLTLEEPTFIDAAVRAVSLLSEATPEPLDYTGLETLVRNPRATASTAPSATPRGLGAFDRRRSTKEVPSSANGWLLATSEQVQALAIQWHDAPENANMSDIIDTLLAITKAQARIIARLDLRIQELEKR